MGSLREREVACSASDCQCLNFESCVRRAVSSHHPREVLLVQFSLYVHKGGLKLHSFNLFRPRTYVHLTHSHIHSNLVPPGYKPQSIQMSHRDQPLSERRVILNDLNLQRKTDAASQKLVLFPKSQSNKTCVFSITFVMISCLMIKITQN